MYAFLYNVWYIDRTDIDILFTSRNMDYNLSSVYNSNTEDFNDF